MSFFDFLDELPAGLPPIGPGPIAVTPTEPGGSIIPSAVDMKKRGKKTRIPLHQIKPVTALDKGKLESLKQVNSQAGGLSVEQLEQWGIKYEVDPGRDAPRGVARDSMLKDAPHQGPILGDMGEAIGKVVSPITNLPGFNVEREMKAREEARTADAAKRAEQAAALQRMREAPSELEAPPPTGDQPLDLPMPSDETIVGAAKAAGVPEDDFASAIGQMAQKLGVNMDEQVAFPIALMRLLNRPEFVEARPDFEAIGAAAGQAAGMSAPVGATAGKDGKTEAQPSQPTNTLYAEETGLLTKLTATKDINTWYEAIAFVLLSMLIKPQMAILFFSRASERGQLKAQLMETRKHISRMEAAKREEKERAEWDRQAAVKHLLGRQSASEARNADMQKMLMSQWLTFKRQAALAKMKPAKDDTTKTLQDDMDNWLNLAGKHIQNMNEAEAKTAMQKAQAIHELLRKHQGLPDFELED